MRWHPAWKYIHYVRGVSSIVSSLWKVNILFAAVTFFTSCILCSFCFPTSLNLWIPFCFRDHRIEGIAIHDKEGCCIVKGETFERDEQSHCEPIPLLWFVEAFHKHSSSVALTTTGLTNKIYRFIFPQKIAEACIISPAYSYPCMPQKKVVTLSSVKRDFPIQCCTCLSSLCRSVQAGVPRERDGRQVPVGVLRPVWPSRQNEHGEKQEDFPLLL